MKTTFEVEYSSQILTGLDGSNPLAFLATLGCLSTLHREYSVKLGWTLEAGTWRPRIIGFESPDALVDAVHQAIQSELVEPWTLSKKLPFEAALFRAEILRLIDRVQFEDLGQLQRKQLDDCAAFGSEVYEDDKGQFQDTAFRMARSGDNSGQGLTYYACKLAHYCEATDIRGALFGPWKTRPNISSFRWDPAENREYALQSFNPSDDKPPTPIGVNRLAVEALSLYSTMPGRHGVETVGFVKGSKGRDAEFRWPIWEPDLELDVIRSLLSHPRLFDAEPSSLNLKQLGIQVLYCSRQIKPNKYYRNFTPSFQLC